LGLKLSHHSSANQRQNVTGMPRSPVGFRFRSEEAKLRRGRADGWWQRLHGVLGSFAHKFHAAVDFVFGEQRRNVKFHGTLRQIQFVSDFFVGKATENALKDFFFAAGKLNGALGAMSGFEKLLGFLGEPANAIGSCLNHDEVVAGRLSTNHAVHGEEAGRVVDRKFAIRAGLDVKMGRP